MADSKTPDAARPPDDAGTGARPAPEAPKEVGGPKEKDPTRYGDWTVKGRCIDF
ncbi:DUF1674 domain-containing protein [Lichenicoccus sp.]|uniref:DUF1674 domain-containing protein n=1 Tax=Lichenicoccus sp. TaxID=2781899 RepID=UPI003D0B915D